MSVEGSTSKQTHVTFAKSITSDSTFSIRQTSTIPSSSPASEAPITPPWNNADLPTPPDSNINMSSSTHLSLPRNTSQNTQIEASTSQSIAQDTNSSLPSSTNQSPTMQVHQRRAKRSSAGSSSALDVSQQPIATERHLVLSEAQKDHKRGRSAVRNNDNSPLLSESSRSRTPSPILGSAMDSSGHLSFASHLIPSAEEVRSLLYGQNERKDLVNEDERPKEINKDDLQSLLTRLASLGFDKEKEPLEASSNSREEELAGMVKKLVAYTRHQEQYIDSVEETLHDTRIRSISLLTSLRTTFAHNLASEYSLRARVEAELEGARTQAKKLSVMLSKSESRNEEIDRERAMSAEEEVLWQEEMKDHASAYAQQQVARARSTQMAQFQAQGQKQLGMDVVKVESSNDVIESQAELPPTFSSPNHASLEEPFVEKKAEEGVVTGLGISSSTVEPAVIVTTLNASPLSTLVKERNKLLSDKRYLKSRVRDTEAQRDRLEAELKTLRPLLVRGSSLKNTAIAANSLTGTPSTSTHGPTTPGRSHKRDRSRRRRQATMGDAQAEHLLLAARRLKELNRLKEEGDDDRPKTPPPSGTTASVLPRTPKTPRTGTTTTATPKSVASREMMESVYQSGASSRTIPNGSPLATKAANSANNFGRWGGHERVDSAMSGSGIEDLLQAAQTVITPEKKSAHRQSHTRSKSGPDLPDSDDEEDEEDGDFTINHHRNLLSNVAFSSKDIMRLNESPKRRRVSSTAIEGSRSSLLQSPDKSGAPFSSSSRRTRTSTEGAEPSMSQQSSAAGLSALDLLADQAAASQHPSQSSDPSGSGEGEAHLDQDEVYGSDEEEGMMVDDQDEPSRPIKEGGIGSHYYPRGAYGHPYAQQPLSISQEGYRMNSQQPGYTYSLNSSLSSQPWSSQTSMTAPRNGIYAPRGVSPPLGTSRFAPTYHNGPRISTGNTSQHLTSSNVNEFQSNSPEDFSNHHHNTNNSNNRTSQKGGNTSPDKRLPYVRWSDEEDQKLRKAIAEYGQRWESVAGVVGTRSYHQCRQRYLLMRRKEAAARDGTSNDEARSATSVTAV